MPARQRIFATDEDEGGGDDWLLTYADAITLLMAFFILLLSFSKLDMAEYEDVQSGIKESIAGTTDTVRPIFELYSLVESTLSEAPDIPADMMEIGFDDDGIVIDFSSGSFFEPGTAKLAPVAYTILNKMKRELEESPYDLFLIDVEGHTDNTPTKNELYPSNWELSAARAAVVVRTLIELGLEKDRMKASGYAGIYPKLPNLDITGQEIVENQIKNQRVSIRLYPGFLRPAF